jgi:hypothetical protein
VIAVLLSEMKDSLVCKCGAVSVFICPLCHKGLCTACIVPCGIGTCPEWLCRDCMMPHLEAHTDRLFPALPAGKPSEAGQHLNADPESCDAGPAPLKADA